MEYIDKLFHFYKTQESYDEHNNMGLISPDSIVFIEETHMIYAQGTWFGISSKEFESIKKMIEENTFDESARNKLMNIEPGAQVNTVNSVAGKEGHVVLDKKDVGLSNVDNTSDIDKPISKATQSALDNKADNTDIPTKVSQLTNDANYQNNTQVNRAIQKVVGAAPEALDTLEEIADKLSNNDDAVAAIINTLSDKIGRDEFEDENSTLTGMIEGLKNFKVDKIEGKGLSANDFTDKYKETLESLTPVPIYLYPANRKQRDYNIDQWHLLTEADEVVPVKLLDGMLDPLGYGPSWFGQGNYIYSLLFDEGIVYIYTMDSEGYLVELRNKLSFMHSNEDVKLSRIPNLIPDYDEDNLYFSPSEDKIDVYIPVRILDTGQLGECRTCINGATQQEAGVMTASDKIKLDSIDVDNIADKSEVDTALAQKADIEDLSNVISDEIINEDTFEDITELTRGELKKDLFIDMWNEACGEYGVYNHETGFFELNGLTDITYKEALRIHRLSKNYLGDYSFARVDARTLYPIKTNGGSYEDSYNYAFALSNSLEVVRFINIPYRLSNSTFYFSTNLRKILGSITISNSNIFSSCTKLEEVSIYDLSVNLDLKLINKISYTSIKYMIDNATNTSTITITVHPNVYAKLTDQDNAEWYQILIDAAAKNIQFVTA